MGREERLLDDLADTLFADGAPDLDRIDQILAELEEISPLPNGDPELTPSYHGEKCLGNGEHPGSPCCCDECNYYLSCFPDWRELSK